MTLTTSLRYCVWPWTSYTVSGMDMRIERSAAAAAAAAADTSWMTSRMTSMSTDTLQYVTTYPRHRTLQLLPTLSHYSSSLPFIRSTSRPTQNSRKLRLRSCFQHIATVPNKKLSSCLDSTTFQPLDANNSTGSYNALSGTSCSRRHRKMVPFYLLYAIFH